MTSRAGRRSVVPCGAGRSRRDSGRRSAREAGRERVIVLGDPDGGVDMESGVRPREHAGRLAKMTATVNGGLLLSTRTR